MKISSSSIIGILLVSLVGFVCPVRAEEYVNYCNGRYGFCACYPKHFGVEPAPVNDDGRRFYDGNGLTMTVSGINNALDDTLQSEMRSESKDFDKITYRAKGDNWFVLSGQKGANIVYLKTYAGKGSINHLYIGYPAGQKAEYDGIVARISRCFKPGRLDVAH
jgi:hypothetical protein